MQDQVALTIIYIPVLIWFQASVATAVLAAFFVFADPKKVFAATSNFMVYSVFLKVWLFFCQVSKTFSETPAIFQFKQIYWKQSYSINPQTSIIFWMKIFKNTKLFKVCMLAITCPTHTVVNLIFSSNFSCEYFLSIHQFRGDRIKRQHLSSLYAYLWKMWPWLWKITKQISRECGGKFQHYKCVF